MTTLAPLIPSIGSRGVFVINAPFASLVPQSEIPGAATRLTCVATRKLTELAQSGEDPFSDYYVPQNLDQATYQTDLKNGVVIVTLQADDQSLVKVPSSYIGSFADPNGVPYQVMVLTALLGGLPADIDLTFVNQQVMQVIHDSLGVDSVIKTGIVSKTAMMNQSDSRAVEQARQAKITNSQTDHAKLLAAQQQIQTLQDKVTSLEQYIISNNLATPTSP